jgi:biopolymer transport protein ExbD
MSNRNNVLKIDMTPFVDVGFLLLVFFIWIKFLQQPKLMSVILPDMGRICGPGYDSKKVTMTLYMGSENKIFVTHNDNVNNIQEIPAHSIRQYLLTYKKYNNEKSIVIIKATKDATFKNVADIFNEMTICHIKRYAFLGDLFRADERAVLGVKFGVR